MNDLNSSLIEGNIVGDPLLLTTPKGTSVCKFSIVTTRFYKHDDGLKKEVSFFDIETRSELAESCHRLGNKGRGVKVVGRLKQDHWTDSNGKVHSKIVIVAEHVEFRPEFNNEENLDYSNESISEEL
jgi:single-strand DNA-binding protein